MAMVTGLVTVVRSQTDTSREPLGAAWSRSIPNVVELAVSPDGERTFSLDLQGGLRCYDTHGTELWSRATEAGIDRVVASRHGTLALAYAARQRFARRIFFINAQGHNFHTVELNEPVQAAVVSPDGGMATVAAGRSLVFFTLRPDRVTRRVVSLGSPVRKLQPGPAESVYAVTEEPHAVKRVNSSGKVVWTRKGAAPFSIASSQNGSLLAVAYEGENHEIHLLQLDSENERRWSTTRPGRLPRVRMSSTGNAMMLSYEHRVEHGREVRYEQRLAYFSGSSGPSWTKGGVYTAPLYVSVDRRGEWVVALDTPRDERLPLFRLYGSGGERRWIYDCPAGILIARSSADGRHIATYRADGMLELVRVNGQ